MTGALTVVTLGIGALITVEDKAPGVVDLLVGDLETCLGVGGFAVSGFIDLMAAVLGLIGGGEVVVRVVDNTG